MQKSLIDTVHELNIQLFAVPGIVDKIQRKEGSAADVLANWLRKTEEILKKYGHAQCAELAGLRGKLLTPEFVEIRATLKKKERLRAASEIIYDAQNAVLKLASPMEEKLREAKAILNQILLIVKPSGMLAFEPSSDFNNFIQGLWLMLKTNEHVGGGISKVLTLVSQSDAMRMLAEEIDISTHT
ncbi:MAG: hypothetical protein DYG98_09530 [Haliscomenobacteraceae bacterium CHB4]|nr:hypothetical protein [Saprospiraceae bacterium]MCE7923287.1 hypothetical protein [Haliscomenobacteraceae bacterium CHB4]